MPYSDVINKEDGMSEVVLMSMVVWLTWVSAPELSCGYILGCLKMWSVLTAVEESILVWTVSKLYKHDEEVKFTVSSSLGFDSMVVIPGVGMGLGLDFMITSVLKLCLFGLANNC